MLEQMLATPSLQLVFVLELFFCAFVMVFVLCLGIPFAVRCRQLLRLAGQDSPCQRATAHVGDLPCQPAARPGARVAASVRPTTSVEIGLCSRTTQTCNTLAHTILRPPSQLLTMSKLTSAPYLRVGSVHDAKQALIAQAQAIQRKVPHPTACFTYWCSHDSEAPSAILIRHYCGCFANVLLEPSQVRTRNHQSHTHSD